MYKLTTQEIAKLEHIETKFGDNYLRLLSIFDHLVECTEKYKAYKLEVINKDFSKDDLKYELDKELMDLLILLLIEKKETSCAAPLDDYGKNFLFNERLYKFIDKIGLKVLE